MSVRGEVQTVHVKNTGRCKELLIPGARVILQHFDDGHRKTEYDLISVYKSGLGWVNIDSQVPNKVVFDWLQAQDYDLIRPEYTYGSSRIDFYMEKGCEKYLLEVKGCTLEVDGVGYFPDAVSARAVKHLHELINAVSEGYHAIIAFVIAMNGVDTVLPNSERDPDFATAYEQAIAAGVEVLYLPCFVNENTIDIKND